MPAAHPPMTVVQLSVDSFRRIKAANVKPTPTGLVLVRGRNGQGKSSLIGSMLDAFGVEKSELPITEGEHAGSVCFTLADREGKPQLIVRERITRDSAGKAKRALTIEAADGSNISGPSAVLKELRGRFADPVAFLEMPPAEQVKVVLGTLGLDEQLRELEARAQGAYDRRRDLGRESDRLTKAEAALAEEVAGLPPPPTNGSVDGLARQLQEANAHNDRVRDLDRSRLSCEDAGRRAAERVRDLKEQLVAAEAEVDRLREQWVERSAQLRGMVFIDVEPIVEQLREHEEAAKFAGRRELYEKTRLDAEAARVAHQNEEAALEATRAKIAELLGSTAFPIDGMAYDHEAKVLSIGGIPFSQASQAERLRAAAAVAMAGEPPIRVIFAREGSLLDEESRMQLSQLAEERGWQLWLEVVDSNREGAGIWIEEGEAFQ